MTKEPITQIFKKLRSDSTKSVKKEETKIESQPSKPRGRPPSKKIALVLNEAKIEEEKSS